MYKWTKGRHCFWRSRWSSNISSAGEPMRNKADDDGSGLVDWVSIAKKMDFPSMKAVAWV